MTKWSIIWTDHADRDFSKLDFDAQKLIRNYLRKKIEVSEDPTAFGKPLSGNLKGFLRYRVNDYRLVCKIEKSKLIILLIKIGHRREIYN